MALRTLIVDNYDSFTYNLFQLFARVNGAEPVVVRNDDPRFCLSDLDAFDNVVLSAGPGRPERAADFGLCADVLRHGRLPLLGVCLGHQGLCHASGASIVRAPRGMHGRRSLVTHGGVDLLAGIPSPFTVVRYHSLAVIHLPPALESLAHANDGVLMAVRHRERPAWGVQFHPESVGTEHGEAIARNFARLTEGFANSSRRSVSVPSSASQLAIPSRSHAPGRGGPLRVVTVSFESDVAAEDVFDARYRDAEHAFWLDSAARGPGGRFSFMGDASGPRSRRVTADVVARSVTLVDSCAGPAPRVLDGSFFDWLESDLASCATDRIEDESGAPAALPFDLAPGWFGYLGYELKAELGREADRAHIHRSPHPDAAMIFADRVIAFDHLESKVVLLALVERDDDDDAARWFRSVRATFAALAAGVGASPSTRSPPPAWSPLAAPPLRLRHSPTRYLELVAACQDAIARGESYELCLTNTVTADATVDPYLAYRALRRDSPAPFASFLRFGDLAVLSASPERFVRVARDGVVESRPIKGTRGRSPIAAVDEALRAGLAASEKDRAENLMIVDLVRSDLGACAEVGSVEVPRAFEVETYASVHQLVSTVRARLRAGCGVVDVLRAAFPGGSMTGAPKTRTMQLLDAFEGGPRGIYSGAIGYAAVTGTADFSIVIRTLVATPGQVSFGVGGAITALSDPALEFDETAIKATAIVRLLGATFPPTPRRPDAER